MREGECDLFGYEFQDNSMIDFSVIIKRFITSVILIRCAISQRNHQFE